MQQDASLSCNLMTHMTLHSRVCYGASSYISQLGPMLLSPCKFARRAPNAPVKASNGQDMQVCGALP